MRNVSPPWLHSDLATVPIFSSLFFPFFFGRIISGASVHCRSLGTAQTERASPRSQCPAQRSFAQDGRSGASVASRAVNRNAIRWPKSIFPFAHFCLQLARCVHLRHLLGFSLRTDMVLQPRARDTLVAPNRNKIPRPQPCTGYLNNTSEPPPHSFHRVSSKTRTLLR